MNKTPFFLSYSERHLMMSHKPFFCNMVLIFYMPIHYPFALKNQILYSITRNI